MSHNRKLTGLQHEIGLLIERVHGPRSGVYKPHANGTLVLIYRGAAQSTRKDARFVGEEIANAMRETLRPYGWSVWVMVKTRTEINPVSRAVSFSVKVEIWIPGKIKKGEIRDVVLDCFHGRLAVLETGEGFRIEGQRGEPTGPVPFPTVVLPAHPILSGYMEGETPLPIILDYLRDQGIAI